MTRRFHGELRGDGLRVVVLLARWNEEVTDRLLTGALEVLARAGVADRDVTVIDVPGAYELPQAAAVVAARGGVDAIVALGCVVKGETPHDTYVASACAQGLQSVAVAHRLPVAFGVITANTREQALARSDPARAGKGGHKGVEAAEAAVRLADALRKFGGAS